MGRIALKTLWFTGGGGLFGNYPHLLQENWDCAKTSTRGKAYKASKAAKVSDVAAASRSRIAGDLSHRPESGMWGVFCTACETPIPPNGGLRSATSG